VTHPFHPLRGKAFVAIACQRGWAEERVWFAMPDGSSRAIPLAWCDLVPPDPYIAVGGGRSAFRAEDLLLLVDLVEEVRP
jgi:hypothetical protein